MNTDMWYQLPPDMQTWNNAVLDNISRKIPEIPQYISAITWSKLDPATGDGDGLVEFMGGLGAAPIVIRGNKLAPVDVMATKNGNDTKFYPLSPLFLRKLYADNVIGEPVMNQTDRDESFEGPGKRIQHIKTVDSVKYASVESVKGILDEIVKSASVANWMAEKMPETLLALYERASEPAEKVASAELPDLMVIWKDGDNYYANNELIDSSVVADFCKIANATEAERTAVLAGVPLVRDNREKVAALHIPTDQELSLRTLSAEEAFLAGESDTEDAELLQQSNTKADPDIALTTAYLKDGTSRQGIIFGINVFNCHDFSNSSSVPNHSGVPDGRDGREQDAFPSRELFVCTDGYGFAPAIKTNVRVELPIRTLVNMSEPSAPSIGSVGFIIGEYGVLDFGRIEEVIRTGNSNTIVLYSYITHRSITRRLDENENYYEVNDNILTMAIPDEQVNVVSMTGVTGIVSRDAVGDVIIDGVTHSAITCPYALMNKYAAAYEDAVAVRDYVMEHGRCIFEVIEPQEKTAAENDNPDTTKPKADKSSGKTKDDKGTKSGTDDEEISPLAPQLSGVSPETAMSGTFGAPPAGGQMSYGAQAGYIEPVTSRDMENVVQINSPQVMDAYMMSNLANGNLASRETLLHASDSILSALEDLSQMLFLIRHGSLDFINENDVQVAMNKLTDVAQALGISNAGIGY